MTRRLADVARKVGVSEATVSRVLNGRPGVSESTRTAVLTALDVLGYERPSQLRGERARLVGLVLPELQNPIFPALAEVVRGAGGLSEASYVRMLLDQHVSGMVFAGGNFAEADSTHDHYKLLMERGVPAVLVNAAAEHLDYPRVSVDDAAAVEQALGHLLSLGHRRVGLVIGPEDHVPSRRKLAAFLALAERAGLAVADAVEHTMFSLEAGHAAAARLVAAGITGIVCGNDLLALGAIRAARRLGRSVPGDVSVVGYDDSALMTCTDPPLTTVRQPIDAMGRAVVSTLVQQVDGARVGQAELLFEPELVVRGSTAPARDDAPRLPDRRSPQRVAKGGRSRCRRPVLVSAGAGSTAARPGSSPPPRRPSAAGPAPGAPPRPRSAAAGPA
jgi:DNA-binding LacI/PurR family transcriptional regulator